MGWLWIRATESIFSSTTYDFTELIKQDEELRTVINYYLNIIIPDTNIQLNAIVREMCSFLFALNNIQSAFSVKSVMEMSEQELNKIADDTCMELGKLNDFIGKVASNELKEALENTTNILARRMTNISERQISIKHQRSVCTIFVIFIVFSMLILSIWFSLAKLAPVTSTVTSAVATGVKTLEPFARAVIDKEELRLTEEKEVVKMMEQGVLLLYHDHNDVRDQMNDCLTQLMREFKNLKQNNLGSKVEFLRDSIPKIVKKSMNNIRDVKRKVKLYGHDVQQFETSFVKLIRRKNEAVSHAN